MKQLERPLRLGKKLRILGIDDAPFEKQKGSPVHVSGILCTNTRFEGMLSTTILKDGCEATTALIEMIQHSKFYPALNVILLDGITLGGFNVIDLLKLSEELQLPCVACMRKHPDLASIRNALKYFSDG